MLLSATELKKEFASELVFEDVSFRLDRGEKVALVGRNGAGKTTLLKIICGEVEPDVGSIHLARGATIGVLAQHSNLDPTKTILEEAHAAQDHLRDLERRLQELENLDHPLSPEDLEEVSMLREHFIAEGGYNLDRDVESVLARLGFAEADFHKPVGGLSGGERTRLSLAKLLLEEPELLILDEPTNHLDLNATEWLESWVKQYNGAVLLVSHDRTFLEATADRVLEIREGTLTSYPGRFSQFLRLRAEADARREQMAERQAAEIARMEEFVRRFINSQRTAQARGRQKLVTKLKEQAIRPPAGANGLKVQLQPLKRSGDQVLATNQLGIAFGERQLFHNLTWSVRIGERWGVIGENGVGKSTLIKIVLGKNLPSEGEVQIGSNVEVGYFAQDLIDLDIDQTPIQALIDRTLWEVGPARNYLGRFLFTGDDAIRPIRTLSGGERNKLQLAILTALRPNLLILDEPTNHLDMPSREALIQVLAEYTGTLVIVSHDRYLLESCTSHTLDMRRDGCTVYDGSYPEYRLWRSQRTTTASAKRATPTSVAAKPVLSSRELSKEIVRTEKELANTESAVATQESALAAITDRMSRADPADDHLALARDYEAQEAALATLMSDWERLSLELEDLRAQQGAKT